MGYFIEADGSVRSEESVKKEIESNIKNTNSVSLYVNHRKPSDEKRTVKKEISAKEIVGIYQKNKTLCPVCSKWIQGSLVEHMKTHVQTHNEKEKYFLCPYCRRLTAYTTDKQRLSHISGERKNAVNSYLQRHSQFIGEFCAGKDERLNKCKTHCEGILLSWEKGGRKMAADEFLDSIATDANLKSCVLAKEKKEHITESQKVFLIEYFKDKEAGFKTTGNNIEQEWRKKSGLKKGFTEGALSFLEIYLKAKNLRLRVKGRYIVLKNIRENNKNKRKQNAKSGHFCPHIESDSNAKFVLRKKDGARQTLDFRKNNKRNKKAEMRQSQNNRSQNPYTATIADITGRDTYYANKGDWRFRDSNGQFGSTPLYDDYDN